MEESRVEDRESSRSNEMEGRCESDREGDEVCPATFSDEEKTELKLDDDGDQMNANVNIFEVLFILMKVFY